MVRVVGVAANEKAKGDRASGGAISGEEANEGCYSSVSEPQKREEAGFDDDLFVGLCPGGSSSPLLAIWWRKMEGRAGDDRGQEGARALVYLLITLSLQTCSEGGKPPWKISNTNLTCTWPAR